MTRVIRNAARASWTRLAGTRRFVRWLADYAPLIRPTGAAVLFGAAAVVVVGQSSTWDGLSSSRNPSSRKPELMRIASLHPSYGLVTNTPSSPRTYRTSCRCRCAPKWS